MYERDALLCNSATSLFIAFSCSFHCCPLVLGVQVTASASFSGTTDTTTHHPARRRSRRQNGSCDTNHQLVAQPTHASCAQTVHSGSHSLALVSADAELPATHGFDAEDSQAQASAFNAAVEPEGLDLRAEPRHRAWRSRPHTTDEEGELCFEYRLPRHRPRHSRQPVRHSLHPPSASMEHQPAVATLGVGGPVHQRTCSPAQGNPSSELRSIRGTGRGWHRAGTAGGGPAHTWGARSGPGQGIARPPVSASTEAKPSTSACSPTVNDLSESSENRRAARTVNGGGWGSPRDPLCPRKLMRDISGCRSLAALQVRVMEARGVRVFVGSDGSVSLFCVLRLVPDAITPSHAVRGVVFSGGLLPRYLQHSVSLPCSSRTHRLAADSLLC
jgi:hypothetical protein